MDISFKFDPQVLIGSDTLSMAGTIAKRHGSRIMVAASQGPDLILVNRLKEILEDSGLEAIVFNRIEESSSVDLSDNIVELAITSHCDAIIGLGGLKTQIISRMAAIMTPVKINSFELFEGKGAQKKTLPLIAIPTTGMDVFSLADYFIAVDPRNRQVKSIRSANSFYTAIILDNNLYRFLSTADAAAFVFEGFFLAAEAYCSTRANFLSDTLLEKALSIYAKLLRGGSGGINPEGFSQANFLSSLGSAASSPGFGAALSTAINARSPAPKPLCSSVLFPHVAERLINARPEKMARIASMLGGTKGASVAESAASAADCIRRIMTALNIPPNLKSYRISIDRIMAAADAVRKLDFMANSPWPISEEEVFKILKEVL